jgi:hypothetical protein
VWHPGYFKNSTKNDKMSAGRVKCQWVPAVSLYKFSGNFLEAKLDSYGGGKCGGNDVRHSSHLLILEKAGKITG